MFTYTTCRDCGGLLTVTDGATVHPTGCTPRPTKLERLVDDYAAALTQGDTPIADDIEAQIRDIEAAPPRLFDAALTYASWGWPVFPLYPEGFIHPHTGEPCTGKTPATKHGLKDASIEPAVIEQWWQSYPDANIGLPTGHRFDVIDVDLPDGPGWLKRIRDANSLPDCHGLVSTASGGQHLYIECTGDKNGAGIKPGIDYRGLGGYVVAPPSVLTEGRSWAWTTKPSPVIRAP